MFNFIKLIKKANSLEAVQVAIGLLGGEIESLGKFAYANYNIFNPILNFSVIPTLLMLRPNPMP